jgi:hypothetical protein
MPIFQGTALAPTNALEVARSFDQASVAAAAASASAAAASASAASAALAEAAAEALAIQAALKNQRPNTYKRRKKKKYVKTGIDHWSSNLGLNELFWMCPPDSQESYANICLVVQIGKGDLNMRFFLQISSLSHLISDPNRIQVVVCDSEIGDLKWVNRFHDASLLHPFAEPWNSKFSKREAHLSTLAFEEATALAAMYSSAQTEQQRFHIMKCLMMGALGRQKKIELNRCLAEHRQNILEAAEARKRPKVRPSSQAEKNSQQSTNSHKKSSLKKVSAKPPRCDEQAGDAATNSGRPSCTSTASSKPGLIETASVKSTAPRAKNKKKPKVCVSSKRNVALTKPIRKTNKHHQIVQKGSNKVPSQSPSTICKKRNGDAGASVKSVKGGSQTNNNKDGSAAGKKRPRQVSISVTSSSVQQQPSSSVNSDSVSNDAVVGSTAPKSSRKHQKHSEIGIEVAPSSVTNKTGAQPSSVTNKTGTQQCLESSPQIIQKKQPKRDSSGALLCKHNKRPYNCRLCSQNTFSSWKQDVNVDDSDNGL